MITTRRDETVDLYHGVAVADPYRWLEEPQSEETQRWVAAQNAAAEAYLSAVPVREELRARLTDLWACTRYGAPRRHGNRYFYTRHDGRRNQPVLMMQEGVAGAPRLVLDPNSWSDDGTVALTGVAPSDDGRMVVYGRSSHGSDWQELRVHHVDDGRDGPDLLQRCRFSSVAWEPDGRGFYYNRYPQPGTVAPEDETNYNRVYWHRLGTPQEEDRLVYERPEAKELGFSASITDDGAYLLLTVWHGTDPRTRLYYRPLADDTPFTRLLDEGDALYHVIGNDGPLLYLHTDLAAPCGRVIAIDTRRPERAQWREVIAEGDDTIEAVTRRDGLFVVVYLHDAVHRVALYGPDGRPRGALPLPAPGTVELSGAAGRQGDRDLLFTFTSVLYPPTVFRYSLESGTLDRFTGDPADRTVDAAAYTTTQVFYTSRDGTRVPMMLAHRRDLVPNGAVPTLLYGYGGFNISLTPTFSALALAWLERGGLYAVANLRGGNEYGEEWHQAGMLANKQNVFDDFCAAAEWLTTSGYTDRRHLAVRGGSNGGLLVAACMLQRPDLFGAVVCAVPVADMLRYHRFTVGRFWVSEYGSADADADQFRVLYAYSPLHNVRAGVAYPPILILTADTDDRVVSAHAFKFTATLQAAGGRQPVLLRTETRAGHGGGKPTGKLIAEGADTLAFLHAALGREGSASPHH